jgi:hypothetical protein
LKNFIKLSSFWRLTILEHVHTYWVLYTMGIMWLITFPIDSLAESCHVSWDMMICSEIAKRNRPMFFLGSENEIPNTKTFLID